MGEMADYFTDIGHSHLCEYGDSPEDAAWWYETTPRPKRLTLEEWIAREKGSPTRAFLDDYEEDAMTIEHRVDSIKLESGEKTMTFRGFGGGLFIDYRDGARLTGFTVTEAEVPQFMEALKEMVDIDYGNL